MKCPIAEFKDRKDFQSFFLDNYNVALISESDAIYLLTQYVKCEDIKECVGLFYKLLHLAVFYKKQGDKYIIICSVPIGGELALKYI